MSIRKLFCHVDDFCQWLTTWENAKLLGMTRKRGPAPRMSMSEVMTILIHFHQSHYRDFKAYYRQQVCKHMRSKFPALVSYTRFLELMPSTLPAMSLYLRVRFGQRTGVASVQPRCPSATISASAAIGSLPRRPGAARAAWDGSMASNSI